MTQQQQEAIRCAHVDLVGAIAAAEGADQSHYVVSAKISLTGLEVAFPFLTETPAKVNNLLITRDQLHKEYQHLSMHALSLDHFLSDHLGPKGKLREADAIVFMDRNGTTRTFKNRHGTTQPD